MKKLDIFYIITTLAFIVAPCAYNCIGQSKTNSIAFKTIELYDYSQNNPSDKTKPLPVQLSMWYPCKNEGKKMQFKDYVLKTNRGYSPFKELTEDVVNERLERFMKYPLRNGASKGNLLKILNSQMKAEYKSGTLTDRRPVIILLGSVQAYYWAMFAEQLAKNEFVVVAIPSMRSPIDETAVIRLAINKIQNEPNVDMKNIGLIGYSTGGSNAILYQMNDTRVKAVITLEGNELQAKYMRIAIKKIFEDHQLFNIDKVNVPYCALYSKRGSYGRTRPYSSDFSFYDKLTNEYLLIGLNNLHHEGVNGFAHFCKLEPKLITSDTTFNCYQDSRIVMDAVILFCKTFLVEKNAQAKLKLLNLAEKHGKQHLSIKSYTEDRIIKVAQNLVSLKLIEESIKCLKLGLKQYSESNNLKLLLAESCLLAGNINKAKRLLEELLHDDKFKKQALNLKQKYNLK